MWRTLCHQETNAIFKEHYQRAANWYEDEANKRRATLPREEKSTGEHKVPVAALLGEGKMENYNLRSACAYFKHRVDVQEQKESASHSSLNSFQPVVQENQGGWKGCP